MVNSHLPTTPPELHKDPTDSKFRTLRVLHVVKGTIGGVSVYAQRLSEGLRKLGHDSTVVSVPDVFSASPKQNVNERVRLLADRVARSAISRSAKGAFHSGFLIGRSFSKVDWRRVDVVHLHSFNDVLGLRTTSQILSRGHATFWTLHGLWPITGGCVVEAAMGCDGFTGECHSCPILHPLAQPLAARELHAKISFARRHHINFIANSDWTARNFAKSSVSRETNLAAPPIIFPIISDAFLDAEPSSKGRSSGRSRIIMAARSVTDPHKGVADFVALLAKRPSLAARLELIVLGEGQMASAPDLKMTRYPYLHDENQLAHIFADADVFVSPSETETFGMTLAEAQAVGTPVLAYDVGAVKEAVHPALHPFLVNRGQGELILDSLESLIANCPIGGTPLREWALKRFGWRQIASKQLQLYQASLEQPSRKV
jgi:glycosyltransferase involved in cell wall biosynthesis